MEWIDGKKDERENRRARLLSISPFPVLEKVRNWAQETFSPFSLRRIYTCTYEA